MAPDPNPERVGKRALVQELPNKSLEELRVENRAARTSTTRNHVVAFFICLALTFVFTLPGSLALKSGLLGYPGDNFQHAWFLWHFGRALLHGQNPFYTRMMFYPTRVNLAWSTTDPLAGFLALPLSVFTGPVIAYNFSLILQLALAAFCARLLCLRIAKDETAALIGAMIFGFSPYLMAHALQHLSLVTAFPIPLFVLALDRIFTTQSPSWKMGVPMGASLLLAALAHYNYAAICIVFAALFMTIEIFVRAEESARQLIARIWKPISIGATTFIIGFSPLLWMMMGTRSEVPGPRKPGHIEVMSADALGFAIPSWNHIFFGKFAHGLNPDLFRAGVEGTVYIGAIALALAALGFWKARHSHRRWTIQAAILGVAFWLLSLGPRIHVLGHQLNIPGPAALFFDLPFAKFISAPARFDVIVALCIAILSSLGIKYLLGSSATRNYRYWIIAPIVALLLADYLTIPFPRASTVDPGMGYYLGRPNPNATLCELPQELQRGTILTFPMLDAPYCLKSMWMQVSDGGKFAIVDGYLSYTPPDVWKPFWYVRILRSLMTLQGTYQAPIDTAADAESAGKAIQELNLSAAVVFDSPHRDAGIAYMQKVFGARPKRNGSCTVFRLRPAEGTSAKNESKTR